MAAILALDTPINTPSLFIEPISQLLLFLTLVGARIANKKSNIDAAQGSQYLTSGPREEEDKIKWNKLAAA